MLRELNATSRRLGLVLCVIAEPGLHVTGDKLHTCTLGKSRRLFVECFRALLAAVGSLQYFKNSVLV